MAKKAEKSVFRKVKCSCCGRHERMVTQNVIGWTCSDCFMGNMNYLRKKAGKRLILPKPNLKKGDLVLCADNKRYKIGKKSYLLDLVQYYSATPTDDKKAIPVIIADYMVVKKI